VRAAFPRHLAEENPLPEVVKEDLVFEWAADNETFRERRMMW
jgi:hypothetical protein